MRYHLREYGASGLVRELSYTIFNFVKETIEDGEKDFKAFYFDVDDQEVGCIVSVEYAKALPKNKSYIVSGVAVREEQEAEEVYVIEIRVLYSPKRFDRKDLSELHNDLKSTIAHELEHIYYYLKKRESLYKDLFKQVRTYSSAASYSYSEKKKNPLIYFLDDTEIPAFVRTIYTTAKKKRLPFKEALKAWLDVLESYGWNLKPKDRKAIYDTYLEVAKKMFPNIKRQLADEG